jgi:hypothetical protein
VTTQTAAIISIADSQGPSRLPTRFAFKPTSTEWTEERTSPPVHLQGPVGKHLRTGKSLALSLVGPQSALLI